MLSLLDVAQKQTAVWHVVFTHRESEYWWLRKLKAGFQHVQAWKSMRYGAQPGDLMWLRFDPCAALTAVDIVLEPEPPWVKRTDMTVVVAQVARDQHQVREHFTLGPISCVEQLKALLGIKAFWLRTPWQLYKYIMKRDGVLIS